MRTLILATVIATLPAAAFAQTERAYVDGAGGFATTSGNTSGDVNAEVGVKVAPRLFAFGDFGRFHNLMPSEVQTAVDSATSTLSTIGVDVTGNPRVPAWYTTGGLRAQIPAGSHVTPYVFGSLGLARLTPDATFSYASGTLGATSPAIGDDVTAQIVALGEFTQPAPTNALMMSGGGGLEVPIGKRLVADAGYRVSRVNAESPFHTQGMTFGVGYRF